MTAAILKMKSMWMSGERHDKQTLLAARFTVLVMFIYCCLNVVSPPLVRAINDCTDPSNCIDNEDLFSVNNNTPWYDPRDQDNACGASQTAVEDVNTDTPEQKIAQTLMLGFDAGTDKKIITDLAQTYHIGGMYLTGTHDAAKAGFDKAFYASLNAAATHDLLTASDEEGENVVARYAYPDFKFPSAKAMAAMPNADVQAIGKQVGVAMAKNGLTTDLAPVLDLRDVGAGLNGRSFSSDPDVVAKKAGAFATGLQDGGTNPIFKHFPGFDSSTSGSTDDEKVEMKGSIDKTVQPYKTLLAQFPTAGVMLSNLYVDALDSKNPSSLSKPTVHYLRENLNFNGLITTDDLAVKSVLNTSGSLGKAVADSIAAGVTMPLFGFSASSVDDAHTKMDSIIKAVQNNDAAKAAIDGNIEKIGNYGGDASNDTSNTKQVESSAATIAGGVTNGTDTTAATAVNTPQKVNVSGPTIVIDPGHSGKSITDIDPQTGIKDADYPNHPEITDVFNVAKMVESKLESDGYTVILTKKGAEDSLSQRGRAEVANKANAALALSIHDDASVQFAKGNTKVYPQKVGTYRETPAGKKVFFTDDTVAKTSQAYAKIFQTQRSDAEGASAVIESPVTTINGRGLAPGNIWMPQLFSKVPWIYNEAGGHSAGQSGLNTADKKKYADGLIKSIEAAVPATSAATSDDSTPGGCCTATGMTLTGKDNREKIWIFLKSKGLSDQQAAGVMGNIKAESGFNPARNQEGYGLGQKAWGLAQWDGGRRDTLVKKILKDPELAPLYDIKYGGGTTAETGFAPKGMPPEKNDALLQFELNYLFQESNARTVSPKVASQGFGKAGASEWDTLKQQKTVEDATVYWHNNFEVSGDTAEEVLKVRGGGAKEAFKDFSGSAQTGDAVTASSCASSFSSTGSAGFNAKVLAYAWPKYLGDPYKKETPEYSKAIDVAIKQGRYTGSAHGLDCGGFVTTLLIDSGYEPKYNSSGKGGNTSSQRDWMRKHWKKIGTGSTIKANELSPGDVAISGEHTFVFVGDIPGFHSKVASASQYTRAPMAGGDEITESAMEWFHKP